jgi:anti-sigma factor RsiW
MNCRDALEFLADYLDGNLPLKQQLSMRLHLSLCRHCRHYLDSYRKTISASRSAFPDSKSCEELPEDLVQAILATQKRGPRADG